MKHMNAVSLKPNKRERIFNDPNYICEEKLKGIRAFLTFTQTGSTLQSRGGHDISHRFPHLSSIIIPELNGITLDGELFQRGIEDEVISGWGNHRTINIDPSVTKDVKFMAFDVVTDGLGPIIDAPLIQRREFLLNLFVLNKIPTAIEIVPAWENRATQSQFEDVLSRGGEGIMLKNLNSFYIPGKRLEGIWYKWKGEETFDVIITGFEMAEEMSVKKGDIEATPTKFAGMVGAFKYGMYHHCKDGAVSCGPITLGTCSGITDKVREDMTLHPENWLKRVVEIKGVEQKESGAIDNPRYIRLRLDKKPEECIWAR